MEFIEYSFTSLRDESISLAEMVNRDQYAPDCVAYLARGGWIIGEAVASYFDVPVIELSSHRTNEAAKNRLSPLISKFPRIMKKLLREWEMKRRLRCDDGSSQRKTMRITERYAVPQRVRRILLLDDSADTGASIIAAVGKLSEAFPSSEIKIGVLNAFPRAREAVEISWALHSGALLCLPSSKDSKWYRRFCIEYLKGRDR